MISNFSNICFTDSATTAHGTETSNRQSIWASSQNVNESELSKSCAVNVCVKSDNKCLTLTMVV